MRVGVIGGGAAGMMCAATINELNPEIQVFLLEKNTTLGKKVLISGGGRCNLTTGIEDIKTVLQKYPRSSKFLTSAMFNFPPSEARAWFEKHGVPLKCEADMRVFPVSGKGSDVVQVFEKIFIKNRTNVLYGHAVKKIEFASAKFLLHCKDKESIEVDALVLAAGGQAYRHTGSSGDGYSIAETFGHHITDLAPSLHSFITEEKWPRKLAGVSIEYAKLQAGKKPKQFSGPFIFTHSGVSGPAVFALSSLVAFEQFNQNNSLTLTIDFLPEFSREILIKNLADICQQKPKQDFKNIIHDFVPRAVAEVVCEELHISLGKKAAIITKKEIISAASWLKGAELHAVGRGAGDEFVTAGGVELNEVNDKTMESRLCSNLYFAGEILNVDGFTGGFNLQASWATGRLAGESIVKKK